MNAGQVTVMVYIAIFISKTIYTYGTRYAKNNIDLIPGLQPVVCYELAPLSSSKNNAAIFCWTSTTYS